MNFIVIDQNRVKFIDNFTISSLDYVIVVNEDAETFYYLKLIDTKKVNFHISRLKHHIQEIVEYSSTISHFNSFMENEKRNKVPIA